MAKLEPRVTTYLPPELDDASPEERAIAEKFVEAIPSIDYVVLHLDSCEQIKGSPIGVEGVLLKTFYQVVTYTPLKYVRAISRVPRH